ncbi:MAG: 4Fe-4S dicluster domain-containing protein [Acidobacteria bacterium]|nr:4Fe-4S dicluster domain-containing protein [Acidobacteriota bacterium]
MNRSRFNLDFASRPWRFAIVAFVVALIFSEARLLTLLLLIIFLAIAAFHVLKKSSLFLNSLIVLCVIGLLFHILSMIDTARVRSYMNAHTPPDPAVAADGTYKGTGQGPRGSTDVFVKVQNGTIRDIELGYYLDAISIDRENMDVVRNIILARNSLDLNPDLIDRTPATRGFYDAVSNALWAADSGLPGVSVFTRMSYFLTRHHFSRFTFNALAVVFIVFLLFDYALQSVFRKDTGQSLVCYNCQTCVGACPVKMVEGEPYPMNMVLETRLGNYTRVVELARYCVGCGRCAGKCPAGISAPRLAAAAVSLVKRGHS